MSAFYPVYLDLRGRRCIVIGGGQEAETKAMPLLEADARVTIVSARVTRRLEELAAEGTIEWIRRSYRRGDLRDAFLAIAAPDDRSLNRAVWDEAEEEKVILNAVDDVPHCHFIAPAVHREGDISVAVSTGGASPVLAVRLRDTIAGLIGPEHAKLLELLGGLRAEVTRRLPDFAARRALWYRMVDSDAITLVRRGDVAAARARLLEILRNASLHRVPGSPMTETVPTEVCVDHDVE